MRPVLHRGQAPAVGILHVQQFKPVRMVLGPDDKARVPYADPKAPPGYWMGQHTNPTKAVWRKAKAKFGFRQQRRQITALRRLQRIDQELFA